jgi:hypothetical protein
LTNNPNAGGEEGWPDMTLAPAAKTESTSSRAAKSFQELIGKRDEPALVATGGGSNAICCVTMQNCAGP